MREELRMMVVSKDIGIAAVRFGAALVVATAIFCVWLAGAVAKDKELN